MNYGRIRRGPMAADAFTQIKNTLFRDTRLSFRDKGVFGLISTHRDGFGVSAESIAACSPTDGVSAVKTSLRNLEKFGYLRRTRERNPNGTLGGAVYFITDDPSMFIGPGEQMTLEMPSSQPAVPQPPLAEPTLAEPAEAQPTVVQSTHKKTSSKNTSTKKTLSPPEAHPAAALEARRTDEREIDPLVQKLMDDHDATEDEATAVIDQVRAERRIGNLASWATSATGQLDIKQRLYALRSKTRNASRPAAVGLPAWCESEDCNPHTRMRTESCGPNGYPVSEPCKACHPDMIKDTAA